MSDEGAVGDSGATIHEIPDGGSGQGDGALVQDVSSEGMADALKAAEAALTEDGDRPDGDPTPETIKDKVEAAQESQEPDEGEELLTELEKNLAKRRTEAKEKLRVREELAQERAQLEQQRAEFQQMRQKLQNDWKTIQKLTSDPAEAIRALGWEPEQFIADLAASGTPEHKQRSEFDSLRAELAAVKNQLAQRQTQEQEQAQQRQRYQQQQLVSQAESEFTAVANSEDFASLSRLFNGGMGHEVIRQAHDVAERYYQATGEPASFRDVAEYLETKYASALGLQEQPRTGKPPQGKRGAPTLGSIQPERSLGFEPNQEDSDEDALKKALAATKAELKRMSAG